jgi:hypothetical protein
MEFTFSANPGSLPPFSRVLLQCHGGRTQVSSRRVAYWQARYTIAHHLRQPGFLGSTALYSYEAPRTKANKLWAKPRPILG